MPTLGLIAEGDFDIHGYSPLIRKENAGLHVQIIPRPCGKSVSGRFVNILKEFKYAQPTIDRAVIVADAHARNHETWREELRGQARNLDMPFSLECVVVVQELEAILLCDPEAIASVCAERGTPVQIPQLTQSPELLADPKKELVRLLGLARLGYTKIVAGQIADRAALERLRHWSHSYRRFQAAVRF